MDSKSLKEIEQKWQKKWKEHKVFQPKPDDNKEKFFATVPYPYANSVLHIGHGRAYTTTDIFARFQRLKGKNVLFPLAFHISGTPVLAVADGIKRGDKKQIELTRDAISDYVEDEKKQEELLETFHDPYAIAKFFSNTIEGSLDSVGISIDWSRKFATGDDTYTKFIEWLYYQLSEKNILKQGSYPILYSLDDENAVGEDDIKDGDTDKVSIQEMTYILFEAVDQDFYFVAATLRPDALFGTTNMWINKDADLAKIQVGDEKWVVDKAAVSKIAYQNPGASIISEHKGHEFIGMSAIAPLTNRKIPVVHAPFVDPNHGTGVVYSSPSGSPHDYMALVDAVKNGHLETMPEIPVTVTTYNKKNEIVYYEGKCPAEDKCRKFGISSLEDEDKLEQAKQELYKEEHYGGKLNELCGETFNGIPIKKAKEHVYTSLNEAKLGNIFYETSRRAFTRGGSRVIVAVLEGQWFLDYRDEKTKENALKLLDSMSYLPHHLKDTQKGYINWVTMRPCARKRGIGTPLPYDKEWVIEPLSDSTIYPQLYIIHHIIEREKLSSDQLLPELFDYVFLEKGNSKDVSKITNISVEILDEMRVEVDYWRAFDIRYTGEPHMSNHLTFLIYHYSLLFPQKLWPKNITVGGMLIKDGEKISKSKGNGIPLQRVGSIYGADLYRLNVALASNYDSELDFKDDDIYKLEKKFGKWNEIIQLGIQSAQPREFNRLQKWLISKFYSRIQIYLKEFEEMRIREAYVSVFYEFLNDVAYFEKRESQQKLGEVMNYILSDYLKIMTPVIPHSCEEYWEQLDFSGFVSLAEFQTNCDEFIDKEIEEIENIAENIHTSILRMKDQKGYSNITSIVITQAPLQRFSLFDVLSNCLEKEMNPKEIFSTLNQQFPTEKKIISSFVPKTLGAGLSAYLSQKEERDFLEDFAEALRIEFNCEIEINQFDKEAPPSILPGKPQIKIERK